MRKMYLWFLLFFYPSFFLFSQNQTLSIEDAVIGGYFYLAPEDIVQYQWTDDNIFIFEKDNIIFKYNVNEDNLKLILTLDWINEIFSKEKLNSIRYFPELFWKDANLVNLVHEKRYITINIKLQKVVDNIALPEGFENIDLDPTYKKIAFTVGNNLYIGNKGGEIIQITSDQNKGIEYGNIVHRKEFGIEKGTFWSPKGKYLAFYRKDETMVTNYPLVDIKTRIADLKNIKYPMAGMSSHEVKLGVYSQTDGTIHYLQTGEPVDQYLTNICWSPDEKFIYIAVLNRGQNHMMLNQYNAHTGDFVKTLFEEKHDKYVEPQHPMFFLKSDPTKFVWQSRRDGFNHLYLYNNDGQMISQLTQGEWEVTELLQTDQSGNWLYYISTQESPIDRHIYRVNLTTNKIQRLSKDDGVHEALLSKEGKLIMDRYSSMENPNKINFINNEGAILRNFISSQNPLIDYRLGKIELGTITADDGETPLYYKLIKPVNFDPNKKYPVIVYVYGGPHAQMVLNSWYDATELWFQHMASKGYICFVMDNRGSVDRGLEFENITYRKLGQVEMKDQMKGIEFLTSLSYVDEDRIGMFGWSFGGFMTISMMLHYPEAVQVGVAGGPVTDWKYYEVMYGERYMDTPEENPEGYELTNVNNYVENLDGRLLVIHGAMDSTVVWQNSLVFVNECIEQGKLIDYFIYPNHEHNIFGLDRIHLMEKVTQYFIDYL